MKKKIILTLIAILSLSAFAGCSGKEGETVETPNDVVQEELNEPVVNMSEEEFEQILEINTDVRDYVDEFVGKRYEDLTLRGLDGQEITLNERMEGKNFILEFMGTWCPVCEAAAPMIDEFNETNELDVEIISIAINDTEETLKAFATDKTTSYYLPTSEDVMEKYNLQFVPIYFFVDKEGIIQMVASGAIEADRMTKISKMAFNIK